MVMKECGTKFNGANMVEQIETQYTEYSRSDAIQRWLRRVYLVAGHSDDRSTENGAIIVQDGVAMVGGL
jgi:hypothetical protein